LGRSSAAPLHGLGEQATADGFDNLRSLIDADRPKTAL